jgi:hypothetical protein
LYSRASSLPPSESESIPSIFLLEKDADSCSKRITKDCIWYRFPIFTAIWRYPAKMRLTSGLLALPLSVAVNAVYIWSSPGALPTTIPASCRAALAQNLTCDGGLITGQRLESGVLPDNATLTSYCTSGCLSSLQVSAVRNDSRDRK